MVLMFSVDKTSLELVYLKQKKRISKKKSCLLKKKFHVREKKKKTIPEISFVLACEASMSFFFYRGLFRRVCVQQNVICFFFLLKKKSENI